MSTRNKMLAFAGMTAAAVSIALASPAHASTPGCSSLGPSCGDNVNVFGNGWDVRGQAAVYNNPIIAYTNRTTDPATDFVRTGNVPSGPFRYEYAPKGHLSGWCVADPGGGGGVPSSNPDGLVLRACNTGNFQKFKPGAANSVGTQLVNVGTGKAVTTNGTGKQLTGGGTYSGGAFWKWLGGPVAGATDTSFTLKAFTDSTAVCSGSNEVLSPGTSGPTGAFVLVNNPAPDLPGVAPTFESNKYSAGDPRWVVELHNGQYLFGFPSTAGPVTSSTTWTWVNEPSGTTAASYAAAVTAAKAGGSDDWVTAAFIVDDSGGVSQGPVTLTDVQYGGQHFHC